MARAITSARNAPALFDEIKTSRGARSGKCFHRRGAEARRRREPGTGGPAGPRAGARSGRSWSARVYAKCVAAICDSHCPLLPSLRLLVREAINLAPTDRMYEIVVVGKSHLLACAALADQSAVGGDKSAPTVLPEYFVNEHNWAPTQEGRASEVRPCISCNQGCQVRNVMNVQLSCNVNPDVVGASHFVPTHSAHQFIASENDQQNGYHAPETRRPGIIVAGVSYTYVQELRQHSPEQFADIAILKLGVVNPLPEQELRNFLAQLDTVLVLEELEPIISQAASTLEGLNKKNDELKVAYGNKSRVYETYSNKQSRVVTRRTTSSVASG